MIFNSVEFLLFCIVFFLFWQFFKKNNTSRWIWITFSSFFFYAWWDWRFLFLIITSGVVDYIFGIAIVKKREWKKIFLAISLISNLGLLFIFKYASFIAQIFHDVFQLINIEIDLQSKIPEFVLILPVGISFYTFQSLSYTIDIYNGKLQPTRNILHFFSYLAMFPQLVAGPIIRAKDFLKQLETYKSPNSLERWNAIKLIVYGLFQKVVIADNLSFLVDTAYQNKTSYDGTIFWWTVSIAFSFQIYNDFSGYSLIARGLAKLMGYHFKMNFNHPYLSKSLKEFWSRWHISLSTWFRDYLYIPLGGSRNGLSILIKALIITMIFSGLWHGAKYTFIAWSILHILYLLFERFFNWQDKLKLHNGLVIILVFIQTTIAWVYFRAHDITQANEIIAKLFSFQGPNKEFIYKVYYRHLFFDNIIFLSLAILIEYGLYLKSSRKKIQHLFNKNNLDIISVSFCVLCILFFRGEGKQFIYFQF